MWLPATSDASATPRRWRSSRRTTTSSTSRWTGAPTCRRSTSGSSPSRCLSSPVFVTDYPAEIKAFYMRMNDDGKTVAAADCLVPGIGEIVGGSQREERLEMLEKRIRDLGMNPEDYWWYCDLRRYGTCKHAGFGLGFERMVMYLTGVSNIRDVELHPRTVGNADF